MNPEMKRWNDIAAATDDPQTQGPWPDDLRDEWRAVLAGEKTIWESGAFPLQRRREHEAMINMVCERKAKVFMEIGADKGGGLMGWMSLAPEILIANEIRGCPYADLLPRVGDLINFFFSETSSYAPETVEIVKKKALAWRRIDVLFIDGNKCEFLRDFNAYRGLMSPGGIVFMHDIQDEAPGRAFAEVARKYTTARIIDTTESAEAVLREDRGLPADSHYEAWLRRWRGSSCGVGVIYIPE
ncbi:MAG TPA: hypothetical protein VMY35_04505 [Phycisphaerae bacterium]|nr:hypothetical protein [Phycisphaerae bacterium]